MSLFCSMQKLFFLLFFLLYCFVCSHGQFTNNTKDVTPISFNANYGFGLELNGGISQNASFGFRRNSGQLSVRYTSGKEWVGSGQFNNMVTYPQRTIRSWGLLYAQNYDDVLRFGAGISLSRGNRRGEVLSREFLLSGVEVIWYEDYRFRAVGFMFDITVIPFKTHSIETELFLRGEFNSARTYITIGFGIGYTFPSF